MMTIKNATRASKRCGLANHRGWDSERVMMVGKLEEWAGTERGLGQCPDGHGPASSHAAEGGAGVEGTEGHADRTKQEEVDDGKEVGGPSEGRVGGQQRRDDHNDQGRTDQDEWSEWEDPARPLGPGPLPADQLAQVEEGLADGRADTAFEAGTHLAHQTEQEQPAEHDTEHLEERDRHHRDDRPAGAHATTTSTTMSATSPKAR
jgi:hypothetical protein